MSNPMKPTDAIVHELVVFRGHGLPVEVQVEGLAEPGVESPGEGVPAVAEVAHLAHPPVSVLLRHRTLLTG